MVVGEGKVKEPLEPLEPLPSLPNSLSNTPLRPAKDRVGFYL
jgi:hypothetical protein